jgi:hypothetical protein
MTAVDAILRQLSRVRRRRVVYGLQRALYVLLAAASGAAAVVMTLALVAGPWAFVAGTAAAAASFVVAATFSVLAAWRALDTTGRVASSVDRGTGLSGRLTTLVELGPRRPVPAFLPLLVEENVQRLAAWTPSRVVPRPVPVAALAVALVAIAGVLLVAGLGPRLAPGVVEIVETDTPLRPVDLGWGGAKGGRLVLAPAAEPRAGATEPQSTFARGREEGTPAAPSLQERIRRRLWGSAWERIRQEARVARRAAAPSGELGADARRGTGPAGTAARRRTPGPGPEHADRPPDTGGAAGHSSPGRARTARTGPQGDARGGDGAPGAGTGTSPDLYGNPTAPHTREEPFELALDAPAQGDQPAPRPPSGETPPAAADEHPRLAAGQRPEAAVPRVPVPAAYEAIVRALFAHPEARR